MQPKLTAKHVSALRTASRNTASLVLFGRAVVITLSIVSAWLGFITGVRMQSGTYDPHAYAIGAGALFAGACAIIAFLLMQRRFAKQRLRMLEASIEELSDSNWELREAEERVRSLLEAQGDTVKLTVMHEINVAGSKFIEAVSNGWPQILASLKSLLETGASLEATRRWPKGM